MRYGVDKRMQERNTAQPGAQLRELDVVPGWSPQTQLKEKLQQNREREFVGRSAELRSLHAAIQSPRLPFSVFYLHGPGGCGKTSLIQSFRRLCETLHIPVVLVDGRHLEPDPRAFEAVQHALSLGASASNGRQVLLIDTYERIQALDAWLREEFLPTLSAETLVVFSGRVRPRPEWRADPGWRDLVCVSQLGNFNDAEARAFLAAKQIPESLHQPLLQATKGHPLALALATDTATRSMVADEVLGQDTIRVLLHRYLDAIPSPLHRMALDCCALVNAMTELLLRDMLDQPEVAPIFEWLQSLSFIELGDEGIWPHDLARDVMRRDMSWRDPDRERVLATRARQHYRAGFRSATTVARKEQLCRAFLFLHRDSVVLGQYYRCLDDDSLYRDQFRPADRPALLAMTRQQQSSESAELLEYWLERQPEGVTVVRDRAGQAVGFYQLISLERTTGADRERDPAIAAVLPVLPAKPNWRDAGRSILRRFGASVGDKHFSAAVETLKFIDHVRLVLGTPELRCLLMASADVEYWAPWYDYIQAPRLPAADFEIAEQKFSIFVLDFSQVSVADWTERVADHIAGQRPDCAPPPVATALTARAFEGAVRQALKNFTNPLAMRDSSLNRAPVVQGHRSAEPRLSAGERLNSLIAERAATLKEHPRLAKGYRALYCTYLDPADNQHDAAYRLGLSFGTYRRHLRIGIQSLVELLWRENQLEQGFDYGNRDEI